MDNAISVASLDAQHVHVVTTYHRGEEKPWGYAVEAPYRFVREEATYSTRTAAERAGLEAGLDELKRLPPQD